jgi:hypothetical protein
MKSSLICWIFVGLANAAVLGADPVPVDFRDEKVASAISIKKVDSQLHVTWPIEGGDTGQIVFELNPDRPLIRRLGFQSTGNRPAVDVLKDVEPRTVMTVGSRVGEANRPPEMSQFNVFFDTPANRPHESFEASLTLTRVSVESKAHRATIIFPGVKAGSFTGDLRFTVYDQSALIHVETVVRTNEKDRSFFYDTGLVSTKPNWKAWSWTDTEGELRREAVSTGSVHRPLKVRNRMVIAESEGGSVACFPPPHQFFFPRDETTNLGFAWVGRGPSEKSEHVGLGIRQTKLGGGRYVPWFNAPPGTEQHLGVFYLISRGSAEAVKREALRYTHHDRFPELAGYKTFTSHWHMALTMAAMAEKQRSGDRSLPEIVKIFKDMGVNIVHLAEFHGDGHPGDPGVVRLNELQAMFEECRRLSDDTLLVLPGEEANVHLGPREKGKNPGHWLYFFPKPVYWTMKRGKDEPFAEVRKNIGKVYHVGNRDEMFRLIKEENGLAWTAHARIKASTWAPDVYKQEDFFKSENWLGAAWKAMPADLSRPRLGERTLDLLDEMSNWGDRKQLLGEVDVFKIDHTHELYGAMNVNYVQLKEIPRFDQGWKPLLDAIRAGKFFVTTGEILLRDFQLGGFSSGEILVNKTNELTELQFELDWTFPLAFAELITGDGKRVYRDKIDLSETNAFGRSQWSQRFQLKGRKWARLEAWDIAGNGTFSQPIWIEDGRP